MEKTFDWLRAAVYGGGSAALTGLAWLLGGWDEMRQILIILIVVDYLAALLEAWNSHSLSSTVGWHGIAKKAGYLLVVLVAHFVDRLTGSGVPFVGTVVIGILAVNECLPVVEHAGALGVPVPKALIDRIEKLPAAAGEANVEWYLGRRLYLAPESWKVDTVMQGIEVMIDYGQVSHRTKRTDLRVTDCRAVDGRTNKPSQVDSEHNDGDEGPSRKAHHRSLTFVVAPAKRPNWRNAVSGLKSRQTPVYHDMR